jgi:hypothetical protein
MRVLHLTPEFPLVFLTCVSFAGEQHGDNRDFVVDKSYRAR